MDNKGYPLLKITGLSVSFTTEAEELVALKNISLEINRGEVVALVGESGSGKSVTALSVLQLLPAPPARYLQGEILFSPDGSNSRDMLKLPYRQLAGLRGNKIAMIFQEPMTSLNPVFTCGDQVMETILRHQRISRTAARQKTLELFARVQLPDPAGMLKRYPHQLSGGQQQRVMIAMAMSCGPALLIADEPTTALDATVQKAILELLKELQQQSDMGVLFITHDLGIVREIADRVLVLYKGEMVEQGSTDQVFQHPAHPYTRALLACRPALYPKGVRLPVVQDFMQEGTLRKDPSQEDAPQKNSLPGNILNINVPAGPVEAGDRILPEGNRVSSESSRVPSESDLFPLLQVKDLSVWFPAHKSFFGKVQTFTKAVDNVSFCVHKGETLGLVGESGCGKTTLGRTLLRLIKPVSGSISFKGMELAGPSPAAMRRVRKDMQLIFQDPYASLNPSLSVGQALMEPLLVHRVFPTARQRREKVMEMLEKVNLSPEHFNRYPHEFSGGQRQRIVIARALILGPSFIICDESVSALDVSVQAQVLNLLNELKREFDFTAIFISHDLSVVRYVSDRIMVMNKGKIVETGPAEAVYDHPSTDYTRALITAIPGISRRPGSL